MQAVTACGGAFRAVPVKAPWWPHQPATICVATVATVATTTGSCNKPKRAVRRAQNGSTAHAMHGQHMLRQHGVWHIYLAHFGTAANWLEGGHYQVSSFSMVEVTQRQLCPVEEPMTGSLGMEIPQQILHQLSSCMTDHQSNDLTRGIKNRSVWLTEHHRALQAQRVFMPLAKSVMVTVYNG